MRFWNQIVKSTLFKVTSLNGLSVLLRILTGLVTSKILSFYIGAAGMALVGNFRNFITSLESIATLGFQHGIVKNIAQHRSNPIYLTKLLQTVFSVYFLMASVLSLVLFLTANYWNNYLFGQDFSLELSIKALALVLPLYVFSAFMLAVINGLGYFKKVIVLNIIGNLIGLILSVVLIIKFKTIGALLSIVLAPALLFFVALFKIKKILQPLSFHLIFFDWGILKKLSSYSIMALFSAILSPMVFLAIRNNIIINLSIDEAGYWEGITRISSYYFLFISTLISVYFLPKLSASEHSYEIKKIIWSYLKNIIPIFLTGLVVIFILRNQIIQLLYTSEFEPMAALFFWQLIGDLFKAISLILGILFFAQKKTLAFIVFETISLSIMFFSTHFFISLIGIRGVVLAHTITYAIYTLLLAIYFRKSWR